MVRDQHHVPHLVRRVNTSRRVGHHQGLGPQLVHNVHGKGNLLSAVALVGVQTPLHADYGTAGKRSQDEAPGMPLHRGRNHVRHLSVGNHHRVLDAGGHLAHAASQDHRHLRLEARGKTLHRLHGLLHVFPGDDLLHDASDPHTPVPEQKAGARRASYLPGLG